MARRIDLGAFTAYAIAKKYGFTGTEEEWNAEANDNRLSTEKAARAAAEYARQAAATRDTAVGEINTEKNAGLSAMTQAVQDHLQTLEDKRDEIIDSIPADYTDLSNQVSTLSWDIAGKAPAIICEAAGKDITLRDAADEQIRGLTIYGETAQQSGEAMDPQPIKGLFAAGAVHVLASGKNMCPPLMLGVAINATTGNVYPSSSYASTDKIYVDFSVDGSYVFSGLVNTAHAYICAYDEKDVFVGRTVSSQYNVLSVRKNSFTIGGDQADNRDYDSICYLRVCQRLGSDNTATVADLENARIQMEAGAVPTAYVPYAPASRAAVECERELYELDGIRDALHLYPDGRREVESKIGLYAVDDGAVITKSAENEKTTVYSFGKFKDATAMPNKPYICNLFPYAEQHSGGENVVMNTDAAGKNRLWFVIRNDFLPENTPEAFKAWAIANGLQVLYIRDTPQIIPLEPGRAPGLRTCRPVTHITAGGAEIAVEYVADTKTYIDNKFTEMFAAMSEQTDIGGM